MSNRIWSLAIVTAATLIVSCSSGFGAVIVVNNLSSGWSQNGYLDPTYSGGYFAGYALGQSYAFEDFFAFDLTSLTGNVSAATFSIQTYSISSNDPNSFSTDGGTYDLFATSLSLSDVYGGGANAAALTSGPVIGSMALHNSDSDSTASIVLNSAGLMFLTANEGNIVVLGGSLVSAFGGNDFVFADSVFTPSNSLTITTSDTPEPSFLLALGGGFAGLAGLVLRRRRKAL